MCGRFTSRTEPRVLAAHFDAEEIVAEDRGKRFNVAPTDPVYGVAQSSSGTRRLGEFRWGLVPFWAEDLSVGARMINARAETILEKPAFRRPLATRRCIIPADGFYEWQALAGSKTKQPWYIERRDGDVLAFAGVWESWRPDKTGDERVVSCAVITTAANEAIGRIHDRMPVVLRPDDWNPWLDPTNTDVEDLVSLLVAAPSALFELTPVGTRVNDVRNDGPELLEPAAPPEPEDHDQLF